MEPIKIIKVIPEKVELFSPNGDLVGILDNDHELNKIQIQIAKVGWCGYYIIWNEIKILILPNGELEQWPKGMYDQTQKDYAELYTIRKLI